MVPSGPASPWLRSIWALSPIVRSPKLWEEMCRPAGASGPDLGGTCPGWDGLGPGFPASQAAQCPRAGGDPRGAPKAAQARAPPGLVNQPGAVVTELSAVPYLFVVFRGTEWFVLVLASWQRGSGQRGRRPHRRAHRQGRCPLPAMRGVFGGWGVCTPGLPTGPWAPPSGLRQGPSSSAPARLAGSDHLCPGWAQPLGVA